MTRAFIGVGANLEPERHIRLALEQLCRRAKVVAVSSFFRTAPEGHPEQPDFVNGVVELETSQAPEQLKRELLAIEEVLGRRRSTDKLAPRTIDLDLVLYDERVIETRELTLPDRSIARRAFLAIPLAELAPDLPLPGTGRRLREIAARFAGEAMTPLPQLTAELRRACGLEDRKPATPE